jgi:hypothetical protein
VPKAIALDDEKPRRRRAGAAVIEQPAERGWVMRLLLRSPLDMVAGAVALAAVCAILTNALFMQAGRHPSPMFGGSNGVPLATAPASLLPRPRPSEADIKPLDAKSVDPRPVDSKPADGKLSDPPAKSAGLSPAVPGSATRPQGASHTDPVGDMISTSHRVAAVQRLLTEYGYGQLKPTGTVGSDTQAAIQKFERDRKIPVTGQMSERLVRELTAMTGRPVE